MILHAVLQKEAENPNLDIVIRKWEERSEGRVTEQRCGGMLSKGEAISKSFHIYNLILSLNIPEASKLGLIIFMFQKRM